MQSTKLKARALIALLAFSWAAPEIGAAHLAATSPASSRASETRLPTSRAELPLPVRLREVRGRGLLISAWVAGQGPFTFAVDTGAGSLLITPELAARTRLSSRGRTVEIGGLSRSGTVSAQQVTIRDLALGEPNNLLATRQHRVLIVPNLPEGIDGILDPTEAYSPFGYVIDMPNRRLLAFDTRTERLRVGAEPTGGAVVRWVRESGGRRPFVRLGDNRLALIDTGSGFGLAVSQDSADLNNRRGKAVRDLAGGAVESKRIEPSTVTIGSLVLRGVPTDILFGAHQSVPVLLGRDALYPFRLTFDPASRLIEIAPVGQ